MKAEVGDWLVVKGVAVDRPDRQGLIIEVHSSDGSPPYVVRWVDNDHEATVFPGPDAIVVTAQERRSEEERARQRFDSAQTISGQSE